MGNEQDIPNFRVNPKKFEFGWLSTGKLRHPPLPVKTEGKKMIQTAMEVDDTVGCVECLLSGNQEKWMNSIVCLKNGVIGNNKQKCVVINQGVIPRLLQWMIDDDADVGLRTEAAIVLGSLAKGTEENIQHLVDSGCVTVLLKGL
ncbi:armadillo repeat-containing protein 8-like [Argopecten irradians]|uniref:armadillo repeat-containing protein 8-like n=1 Tax=Argopecten irradians TaxID=31199 RepID=UPI0037159AE4